MRKPILAPSARIGRSSKRSRNLSLLVAFIALAAAAVPFSVAQSAERFTFNGAGWGHGVGMSQYGARSRAASGHTYTDILQAYYRDVEIATYPPPETIRVHLGDVVSTSVTTPGTVEIHQGDEVVATYGPGVDTSIGLVDGNIAFGDTVLAASQDNPVEVSFDEPLYLGAFGHEYFFGKLRIWPDDGEVRIVEFGMAMDSYVKGIAEMPSSWPAEALKAQAVAARTYAHFVTNARRIDPEWQAGYDISASTLDQNYEGYDAAVSAWTDAVDATANIEMLHGGNPIKAYYSSSNGGSTESAGVVFGTDLPYTFATEDPFDDDDNSWSEWTRTYSAEELSNWLNRVTESAVGHVESITFEDSSAPSARVDSTPVTIVGSDRTVTLTGRRFMVIVNAGVFGDGGSLSEHLPSTRMTLDKALAPLGDTSGGDKSGDEGNPGDSDAGVPAGAAAPILLSGPGAPVGGSVPDTVDVDGPQRVETSIDRFSVAGDRLEIAGYAVDPDANTVEVSVRVAVDGIVGSEVTTTQGRYVLSVALPADGAVKDVCVYAHEVDESESASAGCRAVRAASGDQRAVATSATSSSG